MTRELANFTRFRCLGLVGWRVNVIVGNLVALVLLALALGFGILYHSYGLHGSKRDGSSYMALPRRQREKFLEVPQIVWGLNNQKIAFARACLTARLLNRTLLMPTFSASLFYKEVELLQPIKFDRVFEFDRFNSLCRGFVQLGRVSDVSSSAQPLELAKGSGRRWTAERDLAQLNLHKEAPYADHEIIRIKGKNPFLWHDHWPVKDYARVLSCLEFVDEIVVEAVTVISKIKAAGVGVKGGIGASTPPQSVPYVAVHMRLEKDWMIHCRNLEQRLNIDQICSSKEEIMERVGRVPRMQNLSILYLAVADDLLEDGSVLIGWKEGILPLEKKRIGAWDVYEKHPYLIRSAIDFEVCSRADVFVGNTFSTFSSLVVLERTQRLIRMGVTESCGDDSTFASYAYNILGDAGGPKKWMTNMADRSLQALSYGTTNISCRSFFDRFQ